MIPQKTPLRSYAVFPKSLCGFEFFGRKNWKKKLTPREISVRANGPCEQDSDSTEKPESSGADSKNSSGSEPGRVPNSGPSRREKQGKDNWWWSKGKKLRWEPIVQAQEIGVLLLQLGIVMFVMRLLRPGLPLPGSDPRAPTMFVSVPYSEFLSKINSNQVQKVEVDGVHIMFKLKSEVSSSVIENEIVSGNESSKLQDSEALLRSVTPTKKLVYTTTRPSDIKTPYDKMLENNVEFGSPDKRSGGFMNSALVRFSMNNFSSADCCYAMLSGISTPMHVHLLYLYL